MPNSQVFACTSNNTTQEITDAVEQLFTQLTAVQKLSSNSRVLIKPNLLAPHAPEKAITTHPEVIRAVILALQRRGVTHILIADSPGGRYTPAIMQQVYQRCGITQICEQTGARLYLECESKAVEAPNGKLVKEFTLLEPVLQSDFIINLPKVKTHVMATMSGATKNLFGCVPGLLKAEFHMRFPERKHFGQMLVDLCELVRPAVHLADGILAMEGDGPAGGTMRQCNLLLASENPYMLDLALCRYMGLDAANVPYLAAAHQNGLCPATFDEAMLNGSKEARQVFTGFVAPRGYTGRMDFSNKIPQFLQPLVSVMVRITAPRPVIVRPKCIGCGRCAEICPQQVITIQEKKAVIQYKNCIKCFCCHEMCPVNAIDIHRNTILASSAKKQK